MEPQATGTIQSFTGNDRFWPHMPQEEGRPTAACETHAVDPVAFYGVIAQVIPVLLLAALLELRVLHSSFIGEKSDPKRGSRLFMALFSLAFLIVAEGAALAGVWVGHLHWLGVVSVSGLIFGGLLVIGGGVSHIPDDVDLSGMSRGVRTAVLVAGALLVTSPFLAFAIGFAALWETYPRP